MVEEDDAASIGVPVAIGVAVIFAVLFALGLVCALLALVVDGGLLSLVGHEASMWLNQLFAGLNLPVV